MADAAMTRCPFCNVRVDFHEHEISLCRCGEWHADWNAPGDLNRIFMPAPPQKVEIFHRGQFHE